MMASSSPSVHDFLVLTPQPGTTNDKHPLLLSSPKDMGRAGLMIPTSVLGITITTWHCCWHNDKFHHHSNVKFLSHQHHHCHGENQGLAVAMATALCTNPWSHLYMWSEVQHNYNEVHILKLTYTVHVHMDSSTFGNASSLTAACKFFHSLWMTTILKNCRESKMARAHTCT